MPQDQVQHNAWAHLHQSHGNTINRKKLAELVLEPADEGSTNEGPEPPTLLADNGRDEFLADV